MTDSETLSFNQWLEKIEQMHPADIELGLERVKLVAERLELLAPNCIAPDCKIITVGGTNGKGSTVAMIESLCIQANKTTGVYTSPHLVRFNERIKVDGIEAEDSELVSAFQAIEKKQQETKLTFFEYTTLAALIYFKQRQCDVIVLEVGLGGRQDATNIIDSDISVITTIDLDHVDWLGDSLEQIAFEKGGIAREGKPCLVGDKKSFDLLQLAYPKLESQFKLAGTHEQGCHLSENKSINPYKLLKQNLSLAINAFEVLFHVKLEQDCVVAALRKIRLKGRFEIFDHAPYIVLDVAHNPQSAANLAKQVSDFCDENKITAVSAICGMMKDKNIKQVIATLNPHIDRWCFVDLPITRAIKAKQLKQLALDIAREKGRSDSTPHLETYSSPEEALAKCKLSSKKHELILVFGSFITVGNVIQ